MEPIKVEPSDGNGMQVKSELEDIGLIKQEEEDIETENFKTEQEELKWWKTELEEKMEPIKIEPNDGDGMQIKTEPEDIEQIFIKKEEEDIETEGLKTEQEELKWWKTEHEGNNLMGTRIILYTSTKKTLMIRTYLTLL
ncbi:hypothetical protein C0J52_00911 [Blattella germanica]|nr:hypothetical protein C0J52_00911 [Blattella germanica]